MLSSCTNEDKLTESQLDLTKPTLTTLDTWIENNFVNPYNIAIQYRWNQNTVDNNRYLYPPTQDKVLPALEVVQKIWLDSYKTVGGA